MRLMCIFVIKMFAHYLQNTDASLHVKVHDMPMKQNICVLIERHILNKTGARRQQFTIISTYRRLFVIAIFCWYIQCTTLNRTQLETRIAENGKCEQIENDFT